MQDVPSGHETHRADQADKFHNREVGWKRKKNHYQRDELAPETVKKFKISKVSKKKKSKTGHNSDFSRCALQSNQIQSLARFTIIVPQSVLSMYLHVI